MDIASLAFRTDLAMLAHSGSEIEDHGDHLLVRTPDNPSYWWGNFLLLAEAPADEAEAQGWLTAFESAFPEARHRTFGVDGTDRGPDVLAPFSGIGLDVGLGTVMTADHVHAPPRPNRDATYRRLETDEDWQRQIQLSMAGEDGPGYDLAFCTARAESQRRLVDEGYGAWWGAFEGAELHSSMGLFTASEGLARFQTVKTHPDARGRGLAGTLVHRASRYGFDELGATTLVMVADPDYLAIRIYRSVGFVDSETQLQVERKPAA